MEHALALSVDAIFYMTESCRVDFLKVNEFLFDLIYFQSHSENGVESISNRNEYQKFSWG
jgi:hypothetical protein